MNNYMKNSAENLNSMSDDMQNPLVRCGNQIKKLSRLTMGNGTCEFPLYALPPVLSDVIEGVSTAMSVYSFFGFFHVSALRGFCLPAHCVDSK